MKIYKHNHSEVFNLFMASQLKKQAQIAVAGKIWKGLSEALGLEANVAKAITKGEREGATLTEVATRLSKSEDEVRDIAKLITSIKEAEAAMEALNLPAFIKNESAWTGQLDYLKRIAEGKFDFAKFSEAIKSSSAFSDTSAGFIKGRMLEAGSVEEALRIANDFYLKKQPKLLEAITHVKSIKTDLINKAAGKADVSKDIEQLDKFIEASERYTKSYGDFNKALSDSPSILSGAARVTPEAAKAVETEAEVAQEAAKAESVAEEATAETSKLKPETPSKTLSLAKGELVKVIKKDKDGAIFKYNDEYYRAKPEELVGFDKIEEGGDAVVSKPGVEFKQVSEPQISTPKISERRLDPVTINPGDDKAPRILIELGRENGQVKLLDKSKRNVIYVPESQYNQVTTNNLLEDKSRYFGIGKKVFKVKSDFKATSSPATLRELHFSNISGAVYDTLGATLRAPFKNGRWKVTVPVAVAVALYEYGKSSEEAEASLKENRDKQVTDAKAFLAEDNNIKYKPGSAGEKAQQKYRKEIEESISALEKNPLATEEDIAKYVEDSKKLNDITEQLNSQIPELKKDLQNPEQASLLEKNIRGLSESSTAAINQISNMIDEGERRHDKSVYKQSDGSKETKEERGPSLPKFKSQKISIPKILGPTKTIEIGDLPVNEQFEIRNLIVPLIQEGNPATMAFIDPANAGTGYFASTVDPVADLKKDLRFMAQQGLTNPAKIRAKLKQKFNSRDDRRVLRKSRRFYRKNKGEDFSSQYIGDDAVIPEPANNSSQFSENNSGMMEAAANDGFTSNASRKKNLLNIFKQSKISINNQTKIMNKQAQQQDSFIDSYFKDAVKGVEDAYAKAYFAGLNSMQDFDSKKEPDYSNLYDVHKETGEDLILSAHPTVSKPVEAKGDGGVVENALEQHRKMLDIAFNVPSGNFRSKQAFVIGELVKIANLADENGNLEAASLIDEFLQEFVESK